MNIQLKNAHKITIQEAEDIYHIMQQVLKREHKVDRTKEHFWTLSLSIAQKILNLELVSMGSNRATIVEPTEVFSIPLQKKANTIVLIHNHPSGGLLPSERDLDVTDRLIQVGLIMKTLVQDHLIITEHSYYSFEANGLMQELEKSTKYVPTFELEKRYHQKMAKILQESALQQLAIRKKSEQRGFEKGEAKGVVKGAKQEKVTIAKQMLVKGYELKAIQEITGLSVQQIGRLKRGEASPS